MKKQSNTNQALATLGILLVLLGYYHKFYDHFNDLLVYALYLNIPFGIIFLLCGIIGISFWIMSFGFLSKILLFDSFEEISEKISINAGKRGIAYMYLAILLIIINLTMILFLKQKFQI